MKVIYFVIRAIAYLFIGVGRVVAFIFYHSFKFLKRGASYALNSMSKEFFTFSLLYYYRVLLLRAFLSLHLLSSQLLLHASTKKQKNLFGITLNPIGSGWS
jgi:hypothetical protein